MEDHTNPNQYFIFPQIPPPDHLHRNLHAPPHNPHFDITMLVPHLDVSGGGFQDFQTESTTKAAVAGAGRGLEGEGVCSYGGDCSTGRWPRQETLTLLDIRSRLDSKFREAIQKGPLWDEVSRIMAEEHGYQRSGKKCREKFENLYKYYKKTRDGKSGRQDGKHYRFFRQLEALCGESNNHTSNIDTQNCLPKIPDSISLSNYSDFECSSSEDDDWSTGTLGEKRRDGKRWKVKIKEFIDLQMKKVIERQEALMIKLTNIIEEKEQQRVLREEEWRRQECERIDRENKFWDKQRAWIQARDVALMEVLKSLARDRVDSSSSVELMMETETRNQRGDVNVSGRDQTIHHSSPENEIARLVELRSSVAFSDSMDFNI